MMITSFSKIVPSSFSQNSDISTHAQRTAVSLQYLKALEFHS